jgi:hypothetical protein
MDAAADDSIRSFTDACLPIELGSCPAIFSSCPPGHQNSLAELLGRFGPR